VTKVTAEERFWAKVDQTGDCWIWKSAIANGYGVFSLGGSNKQAHRVSWTWANGELPSSLKVDHICFNKLCVRPAHLRAVTHKQNLEHRRGPNSNNKSSRVRGVRRSGKYFSVTVGHNGKRIYGGTFDTLEEAAEQAAAIRAELFTHDDAQLVS